MTMRTGKPCSTGSGSPFIPNASIASSTSSADRVGAPIVMPSTERQTSWVLPGADAVLAEEGAERHAEPAGRPGEPAADLVGDAGEGDVALDEVVAREEVGQRVAARGVEHPGQRQPVVGGPDLRDADRGVDPVEAPGSA